MSLSERILTLRNNMGLSQEKFGELFDMSQRTVAAWEAGTRAPSFTTLCVLADKLNVSVDYLLGRTDIPNIYLDTKKEPSPAEQDQALAIATAVLSNADQNVNVPHNIAELAELIRTIVNQELDKRNTPTDDLS